MSERSLQNQLRLALSKLGVTNWRNNVGTGWVGKVKKITGRGSVYCYPGDIIIHDARPLHAGLCKGSADIIGITPITITADMVGQTVGVFTGIEVKTKTGRLTSHQNNFLRAVKDLGGCAGVARSESDLIDIVQPNRERK